MKDDMQKDFKMNEKKTGNASSTAINQIKDFYGIKQMTETSNQVLIPQIEPSRIQFQMSSVNDGQSVTAYEGGSQSAKSNQN